MGTKFKPSMRTDVSGSECGKSAGMVIVQVTEKFRNELLNL